MKNKKYMLQKRILLGCLVFTILVGCLTGCSVEKANRTKVRDLEYHVVASEEIPEELLLQIEEKKAADFKMSFETPEYLYIVRGYGEQATGGYSIQVKELYMSNNAVFFSTELMGPRKGETITKSPSYPYIVIKTEPVALNIVFE